VKSIIFSQVEMYLELGVNARKKAPMKNSCHLENQFHFTFLAAKLHDKNEVIFLII
jgi:hypothetical protein